MAISARQFAQRILESGLLTAVELADFREQHADAADAETGNQLAERLIAHHKLTKFQVARLLEGQHFGLVLGNYVLLEKIGEGGMGEVFCAEHRRMRRLVAVKLLRAELLGSEVAVRRFEREVQAAAQLVHPNIVTAFDADSAGELHFLVMEFVNGTDLGTIVSREGPLPVNRAMNYILQVARGLEYAHGKGIVHRDIKPSNLLLDEQGVVKILDMGLARFDSSIEWAGDHLTRENQIIGTVEYMAPEQGQDSKHVDRRSDIYSLGCTFYRLVTGNPPYVADSPLMVMLAHQSHPLPTLCDALGSAAEPLDAVFHRMIAKAPRDRYVSIGEFLEDLRRIEDLDSSELRVERPLRFTTGSLPTRTIDSDELAAVTTVHPGVTSALASEPTRPPPTASDTIRASALGIDLGTTYSVMARLDEQGRPVTIPNAEGEILTPSVVFFDGDQVIVGREAVRAMTTEIDSVAESPKLQLGDRFFDKPLGGHSYAPEVLQAHILNKLRNDVRQSFPGVCHAVITVPAYFDEVRRRATQDAGYMAGLDILDVLNEPTAAAISYGFQQGYLNADDARTEARRVLIYDLGGGTFDVALMELSGNQFRMLATDGDMRLGGRDWSQRLVDRVSQAFLDQHGIDPRRDPIQKIRLWRDCEDAKHSLSIRGRTQLVCDYLQRAVKLEITRKEFEQSTRDLLGRTVFTVRQLMKASQLEWQDLDRILLVGGATRMPVVAACLEKLSGRQPDRSLSPDESVAHGAALYAAMLLARGKGEPAPFQVQNVNSHSLGVVATVSTSRRSANIVLIPKNTPLPATHHCIFRTHKTGQRSLLLRIVEGESEDPDQCAQVGQCSVQGLPPDLPVKTPVNVEFAYTESGRLRVRVAIADSQNFTEYPITRPYSLSPVEIYSWREIITVDRSISR